MTVAPPFHILTTMPVNRSGGFPYFSHHDSVSALWAEKWRAPCAAGTYPFGEGRLADFEPVIGELIEASGDDPGILYRPDEYAEPFLVKEVMQVDDVTDLPVRSI